jgi:hypothetical protein
MINDRYYHVNPPKILSINIKDLIMKNMINIMTNILTKIMTKII